MTEEIKQDEELKLREEQDGSVVVGGEEPPKVEDSIEEEDERVSSSSSDHEDEQATEGETAEEAEARRERNRQRRRENKESRKNYIEGLKRELAARDSIINEMNQRLAVVERKSSGSEMAQLEAAEKEAISYYNQFKTLHSQAVEQANGAVAADATEKMLIARQRIEQIANIKKSFQQNQAQPAPLDPRMVSNAQAWMDKNKWYDPNGSDDDSSIVLSIDARMAKEGWNPTTAEYWDELDARVKKYLPHRVNQGYNQQQRSQRSAPSPVAGSSRESSGNKSQGYKLSAERVQALKEAGLWDNPKQRAEAIKRFQDFDRNQGAN